MIRTHVALLATCCLLAFGGEAAAQQQFLNLDFELASYRDSSEPWGWRRIPWGPVVGGASLDTAVRHHGSRSLRLERSSGRPIGFELRLPAGEAALHGKELTLTAWVLAELSEGDLRLRLSASDAATDQTLVLPGSSREWRPLQLRVDVPSDSGEDVFLRFDLRGTGTVWLDHLELRVNGMPTDSIRRGEPVTDGQREWLTRNAVRLPAAGTGIDGSALASLLPMFAGARVIGLGEMTHGTAEFQATKRDIMEVAVRQLGVTVIALEESQLTAEALNHWINGGAGELPALMADIYNMWRTEEMVELFEWLRRYNATAASRIELLGIDVSNINPELDSLLAMLPVLDPAYAAEARSILQPLEEIWEQRLFDPRPADSLAALRRSVEALLRHVEASTPRYRATGDSARVERLVRYARGVVQGVMNFAANGNDLAGRDSMMAANLSAALERRGPLARAVVSAHNTHVARLPGRMGDHLHRIYGSAYVPVALTTFTGTYSALILEGGVPTRMVPVPLDAAFPGSIEEMLHRLGGSRVAIDLRTPDVTAPAAGLFSRTRMREIGIIATDLPSTQVLGDFWDVLVHIDRTTATRFLPCPPGLRCWFTGE
jgi:erythromycin esterase